jgi:hypothetical protein
MDKEFSSFCPSFTHKSPDLASDMSPWLSSWRLTGPVGRGSPDPARGWTGGFPGRSDRTDWETRGRVGGGVGDPRRTGRRRPGRTRPGRSGRRAPPGSPGPRRRPTRQSKVDGARVNAVVRRSGRDGPHGPRTRRFLARLDQIGGSDADPPVPTPSGSVPLCTFRPAGRCRPGRVRAMRPGRPGRGRTPAPRRPRAGRTRVARARPAPDRQAGSLPPSFTTVPAIRPPIGARRTGRAVGEPGIRSPIGLFWNTPNSLCDKGLRLIPE